MSNWTACDVCGDTAPSPLAAAECCDPAPEVKQDAQVPTDDQLADIAPCIQAARGEIVRA